MRANQESLICDSRPSLFQSQPHPQHHILAVDDDDDICRLNIAVLTSAGYAVDMAEDGAVAWEALQKCRYDLLITDNNMPNVTGVELLKKIHAAGITLPSIMATGSPPIGEFNRSPWLEPDEILLKPYTVDEMLQSVKKVLSKPEHISPKLLPARGTCMTKILVVDEDSDIRFLFSEVLIGEGHEVEVAEDGEAAWELLQAKYYNLLITENQMPKLTGVELVRKVRAAHMAMPVIMAAKRLPTYQLARNPALQFAAVLSKPFEVGMLTETVKQVLREPTVSLQPNVYINSPNGGLRF